MAVSATSRKAYAVAGKDTGCALLGFLAAGRKGGEATQFESAVKSLGVDESIPSARFLDWYRLLNHDYPFLDYSQKDTRAIDADLMQAYAATGEAPPIITVRSGSSRSLSPGELQERLGLPQETTEDLIAGWLRAAAGITHLLRLSHSTVALRTSPSGGARHPTDLAVDLGIAWPAGLAGSWWYNPLSHNLTPRGEGHGTRPLFLPPTAAVFTVSSHVRRAMWRYRDARAFRPVLIDAGHIVETLLSVIAYTGWTGWWQPAAGFVEAAGEFDPVFGYVIASPDGQPVEILTTCETKNVPIARRLRTNPVISLTATKLGIVGENHLRRDPLTTLKASMIDVLAYATPSSRRDRPTEASSIARKFDLSSADVLALTDGGFLLPEEEGDELWRLTQNWSKHDWFLSLAAHASEAAGSAHARPQRSAPIISCPRELPRALDLRRTSRRLSPLAIPVTKAKEFLASLKIAHIGITVMLSVRHSFGDLDPGTYLLCGDTYKFQTAVIPSDEDVVAAAIGQPWAGPFSCIAWLIPVPIIQPGCWEAALVECGRVAQRLTLAVCDEPAIGVFQSPALIDDKLAEILTTHASVDGAYMVGIGLTEQIVGNNAEQQFQPSSLFAL